MKRIRSSDAFFPSYRKQHQTGSDIGRFWARMMRGVMFVNMGTGRWSGLDIGGTGE